MKNYILFSVAVLLASTVLRAQDMQQVAAQNYAQLEQQKNYGSGVQKAPDANFTIAVQKLIKRRKASKPQRKADKARKKDEKVNGVSLPGGYRQAPNGDLVSPDGHVVKSNTPKAKKQQAKEREKMLNELHKAAEDPQ